MITQLRRTRAAAATLAMVVAAGCSTPEGDAAPPAAGTMATEPAVASAEDEPMPESVAEPTPSEAEPSAAEPSDTSGGNGADPRPDWLGTRVLPRRDDGFGEVQPTPRILRNRRLESPAHLPDPPDETFTAEVQRVPQNILDRATWSDECPVGVDDLRYMRLTFWGFDDRPHTGELLVHADAARPLVSVFRRLYRQRFPIEEMRVVTPAELDAPPTGDGNNTTAFVCRPSRGSTSWSQHAYGLAVDVNPFHNPYVKGDLVLPELASAYVDRDRRRPGMVNQRVVDAFADIGWGWGGAWSSPVDPMHFSANGR